MLAWTRTHEKKEILAWKLDNPSRQGAINNYETLTIATSPAVVCSFGLIVRPPLMAERIVCPSLLRCPHLRLIRGGGAAMPKTTCMRGKCLKTFNHPWSLFSRNLLPTHSRRQPTNT